jgi:putative copper export protein/mono/diheme cytochrome c family protein/peroxiredoxin
VHRLQDRHVNAVLASIRAAYFLAAIVIFGEFAFRWWVERSVLYRFPGTVSDRLLCRRLRLAAMAVAIAVALLSSVLWFIVQVQVMSGVNFDELGTGTFRDALFDTGFGRVSLLRFGLSLALAAALMLPGAARRNRGAANFAAAMAFALLSSVALTGHANGDQGPSRAIHLASDVMHLIAASAWLGGLPPLALVLFEARRDARAQSLELAAHATRRFSTLGMAAVGMLCITGGVNAWYIDGSLPALLGTEHGRLLLLKLLLFATMLGLAAINRLRHTPRLPATGVGAHDASRYRVLTRIGTLAICELALGVAVLGVAGALGSATPGAHSQIVWPIRFTFSLGAVREHLIPAAACLVAIAASIALAFELKRVRRIALTCAVVVAIFALSTLLSYMAVPAYPSTYFRSPVRYSAESIARGLQLYATQCSRCHGPHGRGDGPAAAALTTRPADLTEHVLYHPVGEIWWWIKHGIPDTPMPAFEAVIDERGIWDLVNLLRARAAAEQLPEIADSALSLPVDAPDFTFQIGHNPQESLSEQRGRYCVLLVLFDPAEPRERLHRLARYRRRFEQAGLRIIAIPFHDEAARSSAPEIDDAIVGHADPQIVAAYAIFSRAQPDSGSYARTAHAEFLIDRQGHVRSRWTSRRGAAWPSESVLTARVRALEQQNLALSVPAEHDHVH